MSSGVSNEDEVATGCQGKSSCFSSFEVCLLEEDQLSKKIRLELMKMGSPSTELLRVLVMLMLSQGIKFKPP